MLRIGLIAAVVFVLGCSEPFVPAQPGTAPAIPARPLAAPPATPWLVTMPTPAPYGNNLATGVTGDGLVVGTAGFPGTGQSRAWAAMVDPVTRKVSGSVVLEPLPKSIGSEANGVSGALIAGTSITSRYRRQAVYWIYPDPTPHPVPVPIEGDGWSTAQAAGGGIVVGWFSDESLLPRAFFYEAGAASVGEIPVPMPSKAMGVSEDGTIWSGCYGGKAFLRGRISVDMYPLNTTGHYLPPRGCAVDVDNTGFAVGYSENTPPEPSFFLAAVGSAPLWHFVFTSERATSAALATGLTSVGWLDTSDLRPDVFGVAPGRYGFYLAGRTPILLPSIGQPSEAWAVSSNNACLIAGRSGGLAVVWGC